MIKFLIGERVPILASAVILFVGITWYQSLVPPFEAVENTVQPVVVKQGGVINVCRDVNYTASSTISISRHLVRYDAELGLYGSRAIGNLVPSTPREVGHINICRDVTVPKEVSIGKWVLWSHVTVTSFPWWTRTFKVLPLDVTVVGNE
jgi:hypothetical protein